MIPAYEKRFALNVRVVIPLLSILSANDSVNNFDYLQSIGNWNIIQNINSQFREESLAKEKEIDLRILLITERQVDTEVQRIFAEIEKTTKNSLGYQKPT